MLLGVRRSGVYVYKSPLGPSHRPESSNVRNQRCFCKEETLLLRIQSRAQRDIRILTEQEVTVHLNRSALSGK